MIAEGYQGVRMLKRCIIAMEEWMANGTLLRVDVGTQSAAVSKLTEIQAPSRRISGKAGFVF